MNDFAATQLTTIAIFCKAAELGGFTATAHALGITPAAVSRSVSRLEARLGAKLFRRTTRTMQLTDDGKLYFEQCRAALAQIEDAERAIAGKQHAPRGVLRISTSSTYAHYRLLPRIPQFRARYPEVELEINISNRNVDFVEEGYDVAIRLGEPPDSRLVARKLEDARVGTYASPEYLRRHGTPASLDALIRPAKNAPRFATLPFILPSSGRVLPWLFLREGQTIEWSPPAEVKISEGPLGIVILARAGLGLMQTYSWIASTHASELIEVLPEHNQCTRPFYLLYPQNKHLSARVRALVEFLTK
jgi:DNA-binding transcriptional LysR family regulator